MASSSGLEDVCKGLALISCLPKANQTAADQKETEGNQFINGKLTFKVMSMTGWLTPRPMASTAAFALGNLKRPIRTVAVIGVARSGKSTLLNQIIEVSIFNSSSMVCTLLGGKPYSHTFKAFEARSAHQIVTEGIIMAPVLLPPNSPGSHPTLLMDVEGLGSAKRVTDPAYDTKLVLLAMLSSNCLVINYHGPNDQKGLLDTLIKITTGAHYLTEAEVEVPGVLILARNEYAKPEEVRQQLVSQLPGNMSQFELTGVRLLLETSVFCTLPPPLDSQAAMNNLQSKSFADLDEVYQEQVRVLLQDIYSCMKPKNKDGTFLSGDHLLEVLIQCVKKMNDGDIGSVAGSLAELQHQVVDAAEREADAKFKGVEEEAISCTDEEQLMAAYFKAKEAALNVFDAKCAKAGTPDFAAIKRQQIIDRWEQFLATAKRLVAFREQIRQAEETRAKLQAKLNETAASIDNPEDIDSATLEELKILVKRLITELAHTDEQHRAALLAAEREIEELKRQLKSRDNRRCKIM